MKKLDRYIIKNFLTTFVFAILLFIVITVVIDASEKADNFVASKLGFTQIVKQYYVGFIPHMTALLFPLFVFIAVIFFTSRMAGRSEIIAVLASGVSYRRWLLPYFIGGSFLAFVLWWANLQLIPKANEIRTSFEALYVDANSSYENLMKNLNNNSDVYIKLDSFTYAGIKSYDIQGKSSSNYFTYKIVNNNVVENMRAERLFWDTATEKKKPLWKVENYTTRNFKNAQETLSFNLKKPVNNLVKPAELLREKYTKDKLSTSDLQAYIKKEKQRGAENINELLIEQGRRNATPVTVLLLTLIGAIVAGRKVRGGSGSHLAFGFITAAVFILADRFSSVFSTKGNLSPSIAVWIPNIIFCFVIIYLYKKAPK